MATNTGLIFILICVISGNIIGCLAADICSLVTCNYPTICQNGTCICRKGFDTRNCTESSDKCYCPVGKVCTYGNCSCSNKQAFTCAMQPTCVGNISITCKHNGTCVVVDKKPYCTCPSTVNATTDCNQNKCDGNPCTKGKCIPRENNDFDCDCPFGGVGKNCDLAMKCTKNFCTNNGTCYENNRAICKCLPGYSGPRCEENTKLNASSCAKFGGFLSKIDTNVTECFCQPEFTGKICNLGDCRQDNFCENNGLCYSDPVTQFKCICPPGWKGQFCTEDIDECLKSPCGSNGTCINKNGTYECRCPDNTTGMDCIQTDACLFPEKCKQLAKDGTCNAYCNNINCKYDGGDCILRTDPWSKCPEVPGFCRYLSGNGICNTECNNELCLFDLMDCNLMPNVACSEQCKTTWGDGTCQSGCNTRECGYDASDCQNVSKTSVIGTIIVTFLSESPEAYKTIGRIISSYSRTILSKTAVTNQSLSLSSKPFGLVWGNISQTSVTNQSSSQNITSRTIPQYTVFFAVSNSRNCTGNVSIADTLCWNNTETLSRFVAALFIKNETIFQHNMTQIVVINIQECTVGRYGVNCDNVCGQCNNSNECNMASGFCSDGCVKGYWGKKCDNQCSPNCQKGCEQDGNCTDLACNIGYQGSQCLDECPKGKYGINCMYNCSSHCDINTCVNVNGSCSCHPGYKGEQCELECTNNTFGFNCMRSCGHCLNSIPCNKVNGNCPDGCMSGYSGNNCDFVCMKGRYGKNCSKTCVNCANSDCIPETGICRSKCNPGWTGDTCMTASKAEAGTNNSTIIAVIIVMVVVILLGLALAFILWRRSKDGSYVLDEKATEMASIKGMNGNEPLNNTVADEVEPLVAVTTNEKAFPNAKHITESHEGIDLDNEEDQQRSSKASDFRPDSIHGNGPGGVYVGSKEPIHRNTNKPGSDNVSKSSKGSVNSISSENVKDDMNSDGSDEDTDDNPDETKETQKEESNDQRPVTTVDEHGVINTDQL